MEEELSRIESQLQDFTNLIKALDNVETEVWSRTCADSVQAGSYSVVIQRLSAKTGDAPAGEERDRIALVVACHAGVLPLAAHEILKRVEYVAPETVLEAVSIDDATRVKIELEAYGLITKIKEGVRRQSGRREAIPERVRREVWRRDQGRCVDCGSRERLEFDHIIPLSRGGSNTARNLELRCESHNRARGAEI
jgi:5-methylcytosine-specific restriction endonuclease McrA